MAKVIGGTKDPDIAAIAELKPTHIIVNEEENRLEDIAALQKIAKVVTTFPKQPSEVPQMIRDFGAEFHVLAVAEKYANEIERTLHDIQIAKVNRHAKTAAYFIWREPYMLVGKDTYIDAMMHLMGWNNAFQGLDRYPKISIEDLKAMAPEVILLSSEPYPFRKRDAERLREEYPSEAAIYWIDGQLMSWYGTETLLALQEIKKAQQGPAALIKPL